MENYKYFYSAFNEITNPIFRSWNRYNIILNMGERFGLGSDIAKEYLGQFSPEDKKAIMKMATRVASGGYEPTRRDLIREEIANV